MSAPRNSSLGKARAGHRLLGYAWVLLLGFVALGSFGIHTIRT